jgi:hypothetical protein
VARRSCKFFSAAALRRGTAIERREHGVSAKVARKIARDHLCEKGERAYPARRAFAGFAGLRLKRIAPGEYVTPDGTWEISQGSPGTSWSGEWIVRNTKDRSEHSDPLPTLAVARRWIEKSGGFGGLRVNLAPKPQFRRETHEGDLYLRSQHRWSKVSKTADGKRWYIARGWKGDVKSRDLQYTRTKQHALIIAEGWVEDDK